MNNSKETTAEPMTLKDLVTYQKGSVVSRTMVDEGGGTVTVFAFDENQGLSEHTAPYDALVIVIDGKINVRISGKDFNLEEGQMIIMPANKPHALKAITKFKMLLVMIRAKQ